MSGVEDRLQEVEKGVDELRGELRAWERQRKEDKADAIARANQRHQEQLEAINRPANKQDRMNGSVARHETRISVIEAHQERSKEEKDRDAMKNTGPVTVTPVSTAAKKLPPQAQWMGVGAAAIMAVLYLIQKLADVVATLAEKIPAGLP